MPKIKPTILGKHGKYITLTEENCVKLQTKEYPNGGLYLITGTKKTEKGYSHQLRDLQKNEPVMDNKWIDVETIEKMKVK